MTVREHIKTIIDQMGVTYSFVSEKTGYTTDKISKTLGGKRKMTADEMVKICTEMNIDMEQFRNEKNSVTPHS